MRTTRGAAANFALAVVWLAGLCVEGQALSPEVKNVVNAASYAGPPHNQLGPGSIATIFGESLASATATASSAPLPRTLAGTTVLVDGTPVPLYYVSPKQINFQVPSDDPGQAPHPDRWQLVVRTASGSSGMYPLNIGVAGPGVFTLNGSGCGPGAILNHSTDGRVSVNSPENSISPGEYVSVFLTGLGRAYYAPPDGEPAQSSPPLAQAVFWGSLKFGFPESVFPEREFLGTSVFCGRAPGLVGVDQVTARLPADAPEGCAIPVVFIATTRSQPATISIRRGGGPCVDPPTARTGSLSVRWLRLSGPGTGEVSPSIHVEGSFPEMPASLLVPKWPLREADGHCGCNLDTIPPGPACPGSSPRLVDGGDIDLQLPGGRGLRLAAQPGLNGPTYRASAPWDSATGTVSAASSGNETIGAYQTSILVPGHIAVTTSLSPGTVIPANRPFRVTWTGGTPDMRVQLRLYGIQLYCECATTGDKGFLEVPLRPGTTVLAVGRSENSRAEITVTPLAGPQGFGATGLTVPAILTWSDESVFEGLKIR